MIVGLSITAAATLLAITLAWWVHTRLVGWIPEDDPNTRARKRHPRPTPLIGFVPGITCVLVLAIHARPFLASACALAVAVGFWDDRTKEDDVGMRVRTKAALLAFASGLAALPWLIQTPTALGGGGTPELARWTAFFMAWLIVFILTNATNFLDNSNGVTAACLAFALLWIGGAEATLCAGAWLGFLPWNWPKGRMFLGDSGSLPGGLLLAGLALPAAGTAEVALPSWVVALAPTAIFFADFMQVILARVVLGYAPWIADRRHITHIAHNAGVPESWLAPLTLLLAAGLTLAVEKIVC